MSSELEADFSSSQKIVNWSQSDSIKILFSSDLTTELFNEGFEYFRKNFSEKTFILFYVVIK